MACSVARERIPRLMAELSAGGMAAAVLCSRPSLRYYTGFAPPLVSRFSVQSPVLGACLLRRDEAPLLFLALELSETPFEEVPHELVVQYSLAVEETWPERLCARVGEQLQRLPAGKLGFEMRSCAAEFERRLEAQCPHLQFVPIEPVLARLRAIKDEDEVAAIREAVALADLGQEVIRGSARPGLCELELFEAARRDDRRFDQRRAHCRERRRAHHPSDGRRRIVDQRSRPALARLLGRNLQHPDARRSQSGSAPRFRSSAGRLGGRPGAPAPGSPSRRGG